jgi:hypothetical protein
MPDFMAGLAQGIDANKGKVTSAVAALTKDMSVMVQGAVASPATAMAAAAGAAGRSISQVNNFTNTFNGDRAAQKNASGAAAKSAGDATAMLARGLAFVR